MGDGGSLLDFGVGGVYLGLAETAFNGKRSLAIGNEPTVFFLRGDLCVLFRGGFEFQLPVNLPDSDDSFFDRAGAFAKGFYWENFVHWMPIGCVELVERGFRHGAVACVSGDIRDFRADAAGAWRAIEKLFTAASY